MLGSLAAIAVIVIGGFFALRSVATSEAERATRERVIIEGRLVQAAGLQEGVLHGDKAALAKLDDIVQSEILGESVVRVKVWARDGTILYSDEPRLIGQKFELGEDEQELFEKGGADADLSDLNKPENHYERQEGKLLEAHTVIRTPDSHTQLLFEIYQRFSSVSANASRLLSTLAPPLIAGILVLLLFQVPLAYSLARRLQRGYDERERLLSSAIEASDALKAELNAEVRKHIGALAIPERIQFTPALPKTRSGKIMRRILRKIAEGDLGALGDTSTLADPSVVDALVTGREG
jgi:two-component system NarL family sensor kinase